MALVTLKGQQRQVLNTPFLPDRCVLIAVKVKVGSHVLQAWVALIGHLQDACKSCMEAHQETIVFLRLRCRYLRTVCLEGGRGSHSLAFELLTFAFENLPVNFRITVRYSRTLSLMLYIMVLGPHCQHYVNQHSSIDLQVCNWDTREGSRLLSRRSSGTELDLESRASFALL